METKSFNEINRLRKVYRKRKSFENYYREQAIPAQHVTQRTEHERAVDPNEGENLFAPHD